jgi:arylsulfatase A-like enzyme
MDRILKAGARFDRAYVAVPVCVPSRTAWFTGLEPEQSGITDNGYWIDTDEVKPVDLGTWLRDRAGYDCYYMGKWHVALKEKQGGFEHLHACNSVGEFGDAALARAAENFLLNHRGDKPFFLSVGLLNPHDICYWDFPYTPGKFGMAEGLGDRMPPLPPNLDRSRAEADWSDAQWRFYAHAYYRFVEMVDTEVGRIHRALLQSPGRDNTVFIFSSDHGQGNGEHGYLTKGAPYEHSLRVPLAIIDPRGQPLHDTAHLVGGTDLAPTVCDYAGVGPMPRNRGKSLKALVRGGSPEWRDWLAVSSKTLRHRIILKGDWKLIHARQGGTDQLFNLREDPREMKDLSGDPQHAAVLRELRGFRETHEASLEPCTQAREILDRWK